MSEFMNAGNNYRFRLKSSMSENDTDLPFDPPTFEGTAPEDYPFLLTINSGKSNMEIVKVIGLGSDLFTYEVERGQEGTTAQSHEAGSIVENNFTAGTYQALVEEIKALKQQSGIAEMGENENGSYIRYENGIQECWHALLLEDVEIDNSSGSVYRSGPYTWDFPKSFIDEVVNVSLSSTNAHIWIDTTGTPVNGAPFRLFSGAERSISDVTVMCMAIGRWK